MNARFLAIALLISAAGSPRVFARTWADSTGEFTIEAEFVDMKDGMVRLKKENGKIISVAMNRLSEADKKFARAAYAEARREGRTTAGKPQELSHDDGKPSGMKSIAGGGHAVRFEAPTGSWKLASVRLYGSRYGYPQPPREDFHVWLCDENFRKLADFPLPYSTFQRGNPHWVTLKVKPTAVPAKFIICVGFNPEQTKGVYVHYDAAAGGNSMVGLPGGSRTAPFSQGDWLIRATLDPHKGP